MNKILTVIFGLVFVCLSAKASGATISVRGGGDYSESELDRAMCRSYSIILPGAKYKTAHTVIIQEESFDVFADCETDTQIIKGGPDTTIKSLKNVAQAWALSARTGKLGVVAIYDTQYGESFVERRIEAICLLLGLRYAKIASVTLRDYSDENYSPSE